jgi:hypothetical protein
MNDKTHSEHNESAFGLLGGVRQPTMTSSRRITSHASSLHQCASDRPEHQEMQQRLSQNSKLQGVYQIGDVYARSAVVIRTSGAILMPKYFAS